MRRFMFALVIGVSVGCVRAPNRGVAAAGSGGVGGDGSDAGALSPWKPMTAASAGTFHANSGGSIAIAAAGVGGESGSSAMRTGGAAAISGKGSAAASAAISGEGGSGPTIGGEGGAPGVIDPALTAGAPAATVPLTPPPSAAGQLAFSELMIDPKTLSDAKGEWFELANLSGVALDLQGCSLEDADKAHPIADSVVVPAAGYLTIARSQNPGFAPGYVTSFSFTNSADSIALRCGDIEIDRVAYDKAGGYPVTSGASLSLDPSRLGAATNDSASAWCAATESYGPELGTPGRANPVCDAALDAGVLDAGSPPLPADAGLNSGASDAAALDASDVPALDAGSGDAAVASGDAASAGP
ncbi:MAG TPA: lamin tail domain-containing protein [Polyangiales bacterium]|jgi:hypothetical protein